MGAHPHDPGCSDDSARRPISRFRGAQTHQFLRMSVVACDPRMLGLLKTASRVARLDERILQTPPILVSRFPVQSAFWALSLD